MIQWFPGHMNKTRKELAYEMPKAAGVVEVMDARLPRSTLNPMVEQMRQAEGVPCLRLLNKQDLAEPAVTQRWIKKMEAEVGVRVMPICANDGSYLTQIMKACRQMVVGRRSEVIAARILIVGVPNTGKSTLVNTLRGKKVAKAGNEAAVTKCLQRVEMPRGMGEGLALFDTPGMLWPKFEPAEIGWFLAMSGAIRNTALDLSEVGRWTALWMAKHRPQALQDRYGMKDVPAIDTEILSAIGARRGCLVKGGEVDWVKASSILLEDLRAGKMGRISFERPEDV